MVREILVVKRNTLFNDGEFQGFSPISIKDYSKIILNNFKYAERNNELENNPEFQQIIPYVWLINPKTKKVFIYVRSKEGEEGRLHNKFSGGVGGHIDKDTEEKSINPLTDAMMRELREEVTMQNYPIPKFIGFLNDDADSVGKVHFGVVAIAETNEQVKPAQHMDDGKFYSVDEIEDLLSKPQNDFENWSKLSWPFVKEYLVSLPNQ